MSIISYTQNRRKVELILKFGYSEKATKFEKIYHLKFDVTEQRRFFQILWPSQNIWTLQKGHLNSIYTVNVWKLFRGTIKFVFSTLHFFFSKANQGYFLPYLELHNRFDINMYRNMHTVQGDCIVRLQTRTLIFVHMK